MLVKGSCNSLEKKALKLLFQSLWCTEIDKTKTKLYELTIIEFHKHTKKRTTASLLLERKLSNSVRITRSEEGFR